jgi:branched-chain amino acid transport system permease protein
LSIERSWRNDARTRHPARLDAELGLAGTWTLLFAGVPLLVSLVVLPDGLAGSTRRARSRRDSVRAR